MNMKQSHRRAAFTLMEVLLAMSIAILVLGAISMAVDFNLRVLEKGRREVEEAQLARAILRRIADDLRSAVRHEQIDVEGILSQTASNVGGAAAGALGGSGSGSGGSGSQGGPSGTGSGSGSGSGSGLLGGQDGSSGSDSSTSEETSASESIAASGMVNPVPGLYGNLYEIQVDVSRLPRIDQYDSLLTAPDGRPADLVSDVKTVAYYVLDGTTGQWGLVRREMDRAATQWAMNNGGLAELDLYQELLAPEVAALEFRYFDGLEWYDQWDSTAANNLPLAVEIAIALAGPEADRSLGYLVDLSALTPDQGYRVYRLLVYLPAAKSLAEQELEAALEAASAAGASSSSASGTGGTAP